MPGARAASTTLRVMSTSAEGLVPGPESEKGSLECFSACGAMLMIGRDHAKSRAPAPHSALTIPSTIFLASENSIMVLSRKKSSFSTPA